MGLDAINIIRKQQGLSLEELALKSGVPIGTLSKISAGITKDPKLETVKSIARALNCSLEEFDDAPYESAISNSEMELVEKYRYVDDYGRKIVATILDMEIERVISDKKKEIIGDDPVLQYLYGGEEDEDYEKARIPMVEEYRQKHNYAAASGNTGEKATTLANDIRKLLEGDEDEIEEE